MRRFKAFLHPEAWIEQPLGAQEPFSPDVRCGPLLLATLGGKKFMSGDDFTALDVICGVNMHYIHRKRDWHDFPALEAGKEDSLDSKGASFRPISSA